MARLNDEQIEERLAGLEGWERTGDAIRKEYDNGDFKGSVDFNQPADARGGGDEPHPDLEISWKTVTVTLTSHSEGGLTENDFELAAKVDGAP